MSVLISIKPEWCERIATGKKTVEVRKTRPQILPPFKCYIYCTKTDRLLKYPGWPGRVIGEFVCDWCDPFPLTSGSVAELALGSCLTPREIYEYAKGKTPYGWHITDLKLYAEPKEINEFKRWNRTEQTAPCAHVYALYSPCESCAECNLKRPPQSWCYIEEI